MIRVGTSGWSYEDWVGSFYPVALRGKPEAWLAHYATRFRAVEIPSTFDALPGFERLDAWTREAVQHADRGGFELSLKLPREATHDALLGHDAVRARALAGQFDREVLDPLDGEGILGAVLVQIPAALPATAASVGALHEMLGALTERRVALEFRGEDWIEHDCVCAVAERLFENPDVCLVENGGRQGAPDVRPPRRARHAYLSLQGRRPAARETSRSQMIEDDARSDHLYGAAELAPWAARALEHEARKSEVRVFFSNTAKAKAPLNALQFIGLLGGSANVPLPRLTEQTRLEV